MPQVPYSGTLQVAPQAEPTPRYTADAIPAAFGVNVWQAVEGLGHSANAVGNEIFARGIAMQDLYNHSEAQKGAADFVQQSTDIFTKLDSMQGKNAVDYYTNDFKKDLAEARQRIRDGLPNDMARKLFDSESLNEIGRLTFAGGRHAGQQNKMYAVGASKSRVEAAMDRALAMPGDDADFRRELDNVQKEVQAQGELAGQGTDEVLEHLSQRTSELWGKRIQGMLRDNPLAARKMYEDGVKNGDIRGQDIARLNNLTENANHTVGARNISHEIATGANGRWGAGLVDIRSAANAIKEIESGGNYNSIGVMTRHGRALGAYQVMEEDLGEYLAKAGLPKMTPQQFLADHAVQDQVFAANFGAMMKKYGNANDAASAWFSGQPLAQAKARGANDSTPTYRGIGVETYVTRFNAALAKGAPLSAKQNMGRQIVEERVPGDPLMLDVVRDRIDTDHNREKQVQRDDEFQNRFAIETAMLGGPDGKIPHTEEELKADPKAGQAWDYLVQHNPAVARRYRELLAASSKGDYAWSEQALRLYHELKGEASDPETVAQFIDRDVMGVKMPFSARKELVNLQFQLLHRAEGDPRIPHALDILKYEGILPSYLISAKKDDPDRLRFIGALSDQLERFASEQKRPPKPEEIKQIGSRLFQQQHSSEFWFSSSTDEMWKLPVPSKTNEIIKQAHPNWTPEQIQKYYTGALYKKLYEKSPTTMVPVPK